MSNKYNFADSLSRPNIGRTAFDLTETKVFDTDVGTLNVGYYRYVNPGDKFQISQKMIVRLNPLVNPAYVRMYAVCHYFFVPFRQLWKDWENFLTRGVEGNDDIEIPRMFNTSESLNVYVRDVGDNDDSSFVSPDGTVFLKDSFYENLGLPIPSQNSNTVFNKEISTVNNSTGIIGFGNDVDIKNVSITSIPHNFLYSAYNHIYNNYYMDENLQVPIAYNMVGFNSSTAISKTDLPNPDSRGNPIFSYGANRGEPIYKMDDINGQEPILPQNPLLFGLQQVNYRKDYFTAMLPFQQRGTAPAIPVNSSLTYTGTDDANYNSTYLISTTAPSNTPVFFNYAADTNKTGKAAFRANYLSTDDNINPDTVLNVTGAGVGNPFNNAVLNGTNISKEGFQKIANNLSSTSISITAPEMYLLFALQRWQSVTARAGIRYIEFLQAIYGVSPEPLTLQIPRYLGGTREPIIISDVIQQSQTTQDSELGQTAGYGLLATSDFIESETFYEHGLIMSILHITYEPTYTQGMPRELTYSSTFDWYAPQFVNLADQAVKKQEVYFSNTAENTNIFGYIGQYDELRTSYNKCAGTLRGNTLGDWIAKREYNSNVELNSDFMEVQKGSLRDLFQVQDEKPFIVYLQTEVNAIRPLPYHSEPGLISNNYM